MNNEQALLHMFKQQHYEDLRHRMQKVIMTLLALASIAGVVMLTFFKASPHFFAVFALSVVLALLAIILAAYNVLPLNTTSFGYMIYACFVLVPTLWYLTGVADVAPYISLIILIGILSMFSGRLLNSLLTAYLILLAGLAVYSGIFEVPASEDATYLIYLIAVYLSAVCLITVYTLYKHKQFEELNDQFLRSSFKDDLTQVYTRKLLGIIIQFEETRYRKEKSDYIFVMFDIDKFKQMNDTRGHIFGDIVLRNVAQCLSDKVRDTDFVVRYGGDEFLVVQTGATKASQSAFIERIDAAVKESCYMDIDVSISYGLARRSECHTAGEALELADRRLYALKAEKRENKA